MNTGVIREYPGYEAVMEGGQVFKACPGLPLVTYGADEVLSRADGRNIFRDLTGEILDWNLWCLSQAGVKLDLLIGETLLSMNGKLERLGYVRTSDFVREELGISSRSGYELMRNAKALQKLPLIREALEEGLLRKSALRYLFQVVTPETEAEWLPKAMRCTVREIEEEVRSYKSGAGEAGTGASGDAEGGSRGGGINTFVAGDDDEEGVGSLAVQVRVPLSFAAKWDRALEVFRRMEEAELPSESFVEALLAEFAASAPLDGLGAQCSEAPGAEGRGHAAGRSETLRAVGTHEAEGVSLCHEQGKGSHETSHGCCATNGSGAHSHDGIDASGTGERGADPAIGEKALLLGTLAGVIGSLDDEASFGERDRELARQVHRDLEEVSHLWEFLPWKTVTVELPPEFQAPAPHRPDADTAVTPDGTLVRPQIDPFETFAKLRKMAALRNSLSFYQGRLLRTLNNFGLYKDMLFLSLGHYTRERLGMSRSTAYSLISLERSYLEYPDMLDLVKVGKLTPEQARHLTRVFIEGTRVQGAWLSYAQEVPVATLIQAVEGFLRFAKRAVHKKWDIAPEAFEVAVTGRSVKRVPPALSNATERSGDKGLDAPVQMCTQEPGTPSRKDGLTPVIWQVTAGGEHPELPEILSILSGEIPKEGTFESNPKERDALIRFFLKRDLIPLWNQAVRLWAAGKQERAAEGGEELALFIEALLDSFLSAWDIPEKRDIHHRTLARDRYQCQAPGCRSRRNLHSHHIIFRSHGGSDKLHNRITLCMAHHLRCLHEGHLIIRGTAPHGLIFPRGGRADRALLTDQDCS
ncbi:MAG: HNH endonuclease signature motif containing protein [Candidatus Eremiobacteraeota bacterium]|nr:HNH endonuclease signature motif containing protein [Candidatus Eremiobacteraeota bacterium]